MRVWLRLMIYSFLGYFTACLTCDFILGAAGVLASNPRDYVHGLEQALFFNYPFALFFGWLTWLLFKSLMRLIFEDTSE